MPMGMRPVSCGEQRACRTASVGTSPPHAIAPDLSRSPAFLRCEKGRSGSPIKSGTTGVPRLSEQHSVTPAPVPGSTAPHIPPPAGAGQGGCRDKPGMTREQVRFALGTPLVADMFHADRWDYVYMRIPQGGGQPERRRFAEARALFGRAGIRVVLTIWTVSFMGCTTIRLRRLPEQARNVVVFRVSGLGK